MVVGPTSSRHGGKSRAGCVLPRFPGDDLVGLNILECYSAANRPSAQTSDRDVHLDVVFCRRHRILEAKEITHSFCQPDTRYPTRPSLTRHRWRVTVSCHSQGVIPMGLGIFACADAAHVGVGLD